ncbi:hypothetical protein JOB18_035546 [Solea senegalensis]|uniref:Uncharacterized protein n=1 Tax=Solea senegalensis TaxID=28829 RepID=A0AAV6RL77_SOLSE|nr:hypothetical protein JOB18_035546 [Solea senegalensis]
MATVEEHTSLQQVSMVPLMTHCPQTGFPPSSHTLQPPRRGNERKTWRDMSIQKKSVTEKREHDAVDVLEV